MKNKPNQELRIHRRRPISGPAVIILLLVLIGLWYGGKTLSTTKTVTIESNQNSSNTSNQDQSPVSETPKSETPISDETKTLTSSSAKDNSSTQIKLPEGYPTSIPAPEKGILIGGYGSSANNQKSFTASYSVLGEAETVSQGYQTQLKSVGFNVDAFPAPGGEQFFGAEKDQLSLTVTVANDEKKAGSSIITINTVVE